MKITDTSAQDVVLEPKSNSTKILLSSAVLLVLVLVGWFVAPTVQRWSMAQDSVSSERLRIAAVTCSDGALVDLQAETLVDLVARRELS